MFLFFSTLCIFVYAVKCYGNVSFPPLWEPCTKMGPEVAGNCVCKWTMIVSVVLVALLGQSSGKYSL